MKLRTSQNVLTLLTGGIFWYIASMRTHTYAHKHTHARTPPTHTLLFSALQRESQLISQRDELWFTTSVSKLISTSSSQLRHHLFWLTQLRLKTVSPHTNICSFCCFVLWSLLSSKQRRPSHVFLPGFLLNVLCKWGLELPTTAITLNKRDEEGKAWRYFTSLHVRLGSPWPPGSSINIYAWCSDPTGRHVLCLVPLSNQMSGWSMMCISIQWADGGNYTFYWDSHSYELVNPGSLKIHILCFHVWLVP